MICTGRTRGRSVPSTTGPRPSRRQRSSSPTWAARASPSGSTISIRRRWSASQSVPRRARRIDVLVNDIWGARSSRAVRPSGTRRSGNTISTPAFGSSASPSTRTSSRRTTCCRSHPAAGRPARRSHGWHHRVQPSHYRLSVFYDLAKASVNRLAFSQGHELEPHRHGGCNHARLPALRDDARNLRSTRTTGAMPSIPSRAKAASLSRRLSSRRPSHPATSDARLRRSPWIPTVRDGTSSRCTRAGSRTSTGSPTWTARGRTSGRRSKRWTSSAV